MKKIIVKRSKRRTGMTLVELLLSLAISATLLTAAASYYNAAGSVIEDNDRFFRSAQQARVCMAQFVKEVRQAKVVNSVSSTQVQLVDVNGNNRTWQYTAATANAPGQIQIIDQTAGTTRVAATNVNYAVFNCKTGLIPPINLNVTKPLQVSFVVQVQSGVDQVVLSGGAAVRQEFSY
jgi:prepilin-type N-terminal cleavage/methylation domain-containing protein